MGPCLRSLDIVVRMRENRSKCETEKRGGALAYIPLYFAPAAIIAQSTGSLIKVTSCHSEDPEGYRRVVRVAWNRLISVGKADCSNKDESTT